MPHAPGSSRAIRPASDRAARSAPAATGGSRRLLVAIALVAILAAGAVFMLRPGRADRLASETIALQDELLGGAFDADSGRRQVTAIMRNIDRLPPDRIRQVREALGERLRTLSSERIKRFAEAPEAERAALLDGDIAKLQLVRGLFDAVEQGGMRPVTEAEIRAREERRREERERRDEPRGPRPEPAAGPDPEERQRIAAYLEALGKRAKEKNVDLGRMLPRLPRRG